MISKVELLHHRLQAVLREHSFSGENSLAYLGDDDGRHKYLIGEHEVYVDQITEFECVEDDEEWTNRNASEVCLPER